MFIAPIIATYTIYVFSKIATRRRKVFSKAHNAMKHIKNFIVISFLSEVVVNSYYVACRTQKIAYFMFGNKRKRNIFNSKLRFDLRIVCNLKEKSFQTMSSNL